MKAVISTIFQTGPWKEKQIFKCNHMKKHILITTMLIAGTISAFADGKVVTDSIESRILNTSVTYNAYLPDGFETGDKVYPVIYLLHGLYGTYEDWQKNTGMNVIANELIQSGEACEAVIIMPNAGGGDIHNIHNGYFNVEGWAYEDFFFEELIPTLEKKYRCIGDKAHRAIMGLSMGGGGSTVYCQRHPDMFSSCYAMSAWLDTKFSEEMPYDAFYLTVQSVRNASPFDFIDNADAETIAALKTVKWFFDCGDDDGLVYLSVDLHRKYNEHGIANELRVHNGAHTWEYWHNCLRDALPFASRNFGK